MELTRGTWAGSPYAAAEVTTAGGDRDAPPVVVLPGLSPVAGVDSDQLVTGALGPVRDLLGRRRLVVLARRVGLAPGTTMADLAADHAAALREGVGRPVDLVGVSTGGSIAQQVAAEHPDVVRRLVLGSTACRLGGAGRAMQARVGRELRRGDTAAAMATLARGLAPSWAGPVAGLAGRLLGPRLVRDEQGLADMATTVEAEDSFDLASLPTIAAPTLVVAGVKDRFYPVGLFEETARLVPGARLVLDPRHGHVSVLTASSTRVGVAAFLT